MVYTISMSKKKLFMKYSKYIIFSIKKISKIFATISTI